MPFCNPDKIIVGPDRFRLADLTDSSVVEIADSINELGGQIQPILVTDNMELVDGGNRLAACKLLNREVWYENETEGRLMLNSPLLRRKAELQANIKRRNFTPSQIARATAEIDSIMRELHGSKRSGPGEAEGWTQDDTAKVMGYKSRKTVTDALMVDRAMKTSLRSAIEAAPTMNDAVKIVVRATKLEAAKLGAKRIAATDISVDGIDADLSPYEHFSKKVILGDCLAGLRNVADGVCNLFVTDPPFGIDLVKATQDRPDCPHDCYDDKAEDILPLTKAVLAEMARVGKPDCHIFMFCGAEHWSDIKAYVTSLGFLVMRKPVLWVKMNPSIGKMQAGRNNNPDMYFASAYEVALFAWRGQARLATPGVSDVFAHPIEQNKTHIAQKPVQLLVDIIKCLYNPGINTTLIDPFVGSGSTLIAAERLGIKNYWGYELDPESREKAITNMTLAYAERISQQPVESLDEFNEEEF
jgi:DNA modification methylase